jgi:cytoskeletal protein RodZ
LASEALPKKGVPWSCVLISLVNLLAIVLLLVAFMIRSDTWGKDLRSAKKDTAAARTDAAEAKKSADSSAGLLQSIAQALNSQVAAGTLTPSELAAIAAAVKANQAARTGAAAQIGTTPGIPGSRSGGGTSVTPGVPGSAPRTVASQPTPPPHLSDTSKCLATVDIPAILKLDGTVCPP